MLFTYKTIMKTKHPTSITATKTVYTPYLQKGATRLLHLTLPNAAQFSKFFHLLT